MISALIGAVIGVIVAVPLTIVPVRRFLRPSKEKTFYSLTMIPIALIYIGFVYYYGELSALPAEILGVLIFTVLALLGQFVATVLLVYAYLAHGLWDIMHEVFVTSIGGVLSWTNVPQGYAAFCLVYDVIIAVYIYKRQKTWLIDEPIDAQVS